MLKKKHKKYIIIFKCLTCLTAANRIYHVCYGPKHEMTLFTDKTLETVSFFIS